MSEAPDPPTLNAQETIEARLTLLETLVTQKKRLDSLETSFVRPPSRARGAAILALAISIIAPITTAIHGCFQLSLAEQAQRHKVQLETQSQSHKIQLETQSQNHRLSQEIWFQFAEAAEDDNLDDENSIRHRIRLLRFLSQTSSAQDIREWAEVELSLNEQAARRSIEVEAEMNTYREIILNTKKQTGRCDGPCADLERTVKNSDLNVKKNVDDPLGGL